MKRASQTDASFSQLLLSWIAYHLVHAMAAARPIHSADEIAARVAASNNPSGT